MIEEFNVPSTDWASNPNDLTNAIIGVHRLLITCLFWTSWVKSQIENSSS